MPEADCSQPGYDVRCEWGEQGMAALVPVCNAIVIVDILSFTTCVTIAVDRGAIIIPWKHDRQTADGIAVTLGARVCGKRSTKTPSLSPRSWEGIERDAQYVLCSPNGATLSLNPHAKQIIAGSFLNADAVADYISTLNPPIGVVPAGERWPDGSLRPAIEDMLGAGAIIAKLTGSKSPEAMTAARSFASAGDDLLEMVTSSVSGEELSAMGFGDDIPVACQLNSVDTVPVVQDGMFRPVRI